MEPVRRAFSCLLQSPAGFLILLKTATLARVFLPCLSGQKTCTTGIRGLIERSLMLTDTSAHISLKKGKPRLRSLFEVTIHSHNKPPADPRENRPNHQNTIYKRGQKAFRVSPQEPLEETASPILAKVALSSTKHIKTTSCGEQETHKQTKNWAYLVLIPYL